MKLFLDLDGICVDFVDGFCKQLRVPNPYDNGFIGWDFVSHLGYTNAIYDKLGKKFWEGLKPTKEFPKIIELIGSFEHVCVLSTPTGRGSIEGKMRWVEKYLPHLPYIFTGKKYYVAHPRAVLLDDVDHNVEAFRKHGGHAILFPRPWNSNREKDISYVAEQITTIGRDRRF